MVFDSKYRGLPSLKIFRGFSLVTDQLSSSILNKTWYWWIVLIFALIFTRWVISYWKVATSSPVKLYNVVGRWLCLLFTSWSSACNGKASTVLMMRIHVCGVFISFWSQWALKWIYREICDTWPVWRQTYGYLPSHRTPPQALGRYSSAI